MVPHFVLGKERNQFSVQHVTGIKRQPHAETHRLRAQIGQRLPRSLIHCSDWVGLRRKLWLGAAIAGPASRGGGRILPWPRADVVAGEGEAWWSENRYGQLQSAPHFGGHHVISISLSHFPARL